MLLIGANGVVGLTGPGGNHPGSGIVPTGSKTVGSVSKNRHMTHQVNLSQNKHAGP